MALLDFEKRSHSQKFIDKYHNATIMGSVITAEFDPLGYKLGKKYEELTRKPAQLPRRYENITEEAIIDLIKYKLAKKYGDIPETPKEVEVLSPPRLEQRQTTPIPQAPEFFTPPPQTPTMPHSSGSPIKHVHARPQWNSFDFVLNPPPPPMPPVIDGNDHIPADPIVDVRLGLMGKRLKNKF